METNQKLTRYLAATVGVSVLWIGLSVFGFYLPALSRFQTQAVDSNLNLGRILKLDLNNSSVDTSASQQTISPEGTSSYSRGASNQGIALDSNSKITTTTQGLSQDFTLSLWLKSNFRGNASIFSLKKNNQGIELTQIGERYYLLKVNGQNIKLANNRPFGVTWAHGNDRLFNLTLVYKSGATGSQCTLYLDGEMAVKAGFGSFPCTIPNLTGANLVLGKNTYVAFAGIIDQVSLWNRPLTAEDIQQYMGQTYDHYGDGVCEPAESFLNSPSDCKDSIDLTGKTLELTGKIKETDQYSIWWADPLIRTWADRPVPTRTINSGQLKLAKNETRITQLVLTGKTNRSIPLSSISLNLSGTPLSGQVYVLESIPVKSGSDNFNQPKFPQNTDPRPDAAVPLLDYQATLGENNVDVAFGQHKTMVVEIKTTSTTPAGNYTVYLNIDGQIVPVAVQVYNFTLPDTPTIPTLYSADGLGVSSTSPFDIATIHGTTGGNSTAKQQVIDSYLDSYADHKIGPYMVAENPIIASAFWSWFNCSDNTLKTEVKAKLTERLTKYFDQKHVSVTELNHMYGYFYKDKALQLCGQKVDNYVIGNGFTLTDYAQYRTQYLNPAYEQKLMQNMTQLADFLREKGWLDQVYFAFDEPISSEGCYGSEYLCVFRTRVFHDVLSQLGFKVGPVLPSPHYFDSIPGNHVIEQGSWFNFLASSENGWRERAYDDELYTSKSGVGEYWWYHTDHQAFDADSEANEPISLYWQLFQHNIKGSLQWAFIGWDNEKVNPWDQLVGRWGGNGGIVFFYPPCGKQNCASPTYRVVPSIRLKLLREGIQDHAYLTLLSNSIGRNQVLTDYNFNPLFATSVNWSSKTATLKNYREQIAGRLAGLPQPTPTRTPTPTPTPLLIPTHTPTLLPTTTATPTAVPTATVTTTPTTTITPTMEPGACDKSTDFNSDGITDLSDLSIVIAAMGQTGDNLVQDLNCDQLVDLSDFSIVIQKLGS